MKIAARILGFLGVLVVGFIAPLWLFALATICYALFWNGTELLLVALIVDVYFAGVVGAVMPWHIIIVMVCVAVRELVRPYIMVRL